MNVYATLIKMLWFLIYISNLKSCFGRWWIYSRILSHEKKLTEGGSSLCFYFHLNDEQLKACLDDPKILLHIGNGTKTGMEACERQFRNERWNCINGRHNSKLYKKRTPEAAYVNAISSAGVIYKLVYECDRGAIQNCGCTKNIEKHKKTIFKHVSVAASLTKNKEKKEVSYWTYCTDHLKFSLKMSRTFLDPSREETFNNKTHRSLKKLVVIQNNKVARKLISELSMTHKKCRCYGPSGQCIAKICYRWLPDIRVVSYKLYEKYQSAVKVKLKNGRKLTSDERRPLKKTDLAYTERLSYCNKIDSLGIPGTQGRLCSNHDPRAGDDMTSCDIFCCDRGYNPTVLKRRQPCRCKFVWCCDVNCDVCEDEVKEFRCK